MRGTLAMSILLVAASLAGCTAPEQQGSGEPAEDSLAGTPDGPNETVTSPLPDGSSDSGPAPTESGQAANETRAAWATEPPVPSEGFALGRILYAVLEPCRSARQACHVGQFTLAYGGPGNATIAADPAACASWAAITGDGRTVSADVVPYRGLDITPLAVEDATWRDHVGPYPVQMVPGDRSVFILELVTEVPPSPLVELRFRPACTEPWVSVEMPPPAQVTAYEKAIINAQGLDADNNGAVDWIRMVLVRAEWGPYPNGVVESTLEYNGSTWNDTEQAPLTCATPTIAGPGVPLTCPPESAFVLEDGDTPEGQWPIGKVLYVPCQGKGEHSVTVSVRGVVVLDARVLCDEAAA